MGILHSLRHIVFAALLIVGLQPGVLKAQTPEQLMVDIQWSKEEPLQISDALYPDVLAGLPLVTIRLADPDVEFISIANEEATALPDTVSIPTVIYDVVSLRKTSDRGTSQSWIDIIPVYFDYVENRYFKIDKLVIVLSKKHSKSIAAPLRTSETDNSVLANGSWIKIPVTESGILSLLPYTLEELA